MVILQDGAGHRRLVWPGRVVLRPGEQAIGIQKTTEALAQNNQAYIDKWANYDFRKCFNCGEKGVYEYT